MSADRRTGRVRSRSTEELVEGIGSLTQVAARSHPHAELWLTSPSDLAPGRTRWTYAEIEQVVSSLTLELAAAVQAVGGRPYVAIYRCDHPDLVLIAAAIARAGGVPALISRSIDAEALSCLAERLAAPLVIADACTKDLAPILAGATGDVLVPAAVDLRSGSVPVGRNVAPVPAGTAMFVSHTSGTTGVPKLVEHAAGALSELIRFESRTSRFIGVGRNARIALDLPWVHSRSIVGFFSTVQHRGRTGLLSSGTDGDALFDRLAEFRPTFFETVPNNYLRWEAKASTSQAFEQVNVFMSNFDAIHPRSVRTFLAASRRPVCLWVNAWGQTESGPVAAQVTARVGSRMYGGARRDDGQVVGYPQVGLNRLRVADPLTGRPLGRGQVGVLQTRSALLSRTYVGQPELHRRRLGDGWWDMGDIGLLTWTGAVVLADRGVDRIDGVESCIRLEDRILDSFPDIEEVVICQGADGLPVAYVSTPSGAIDLDRWHSVLEGTHLGAPKVVSWQDLPRTATQKVRRHLIAVDLEAVPDRLLPTSNEREA